MKEELKYVENFLEMTELRFPGCLNWEIHVDEKCRNASVFPIILLMFTENTIKHNMIMGEELRVRITGSLVERNGEKYVVLTHLDSGSGYFEEDLEYLNRPVSQQVHDFDRKKNRNLQSATNGLLSCLWRKSPCAFFPTNPDGVQDQRLRFHTFQYREMAIRGKQN